MELKKIRIDPKKQSEGVWFEVDDDTSLLIARMNNPKFNKEFERETRQSRRFAKRGMLPDDKAAEIVDKVVAKTVLLGWKGLKQDGEEIPYSEEKALELLQDEELASFKEIVFDLATSEENFRREEIEDARKKSESSSSGSQNGENT